MWQSSNDEDTLWNEWKQLTCVWNLCILMWDRSHQWVLLSYIWCWRQLKCRRCTTRGCPAAVSDWGVSFPRCPEARGAEKKSIVLEAGSAGTRRPVQQSEVKSMIQGDEGWWRESTETGGMDGGRTGDKPFALKAKRGQRRKTRDPNQGWIIEYEECIWETIKRGCDRAGAGCRTAAEAMLMKERSKRRNK